MTNSITSTGVILRFIFAILLVLLTYNPTGYSYFHWFYHSLDNFTPYIAIAGVALIIGWVLYVRTTLESLGLMGLLLAGIFFGCLVWLFVYWGWLSLTNVSAVTWVIEVILAALLAIGMSWSHIHRRMTGQVDVDQVEDN